MDYIYIVTPNLTKTAVIVSLVGSLYPSANVIPYVSANQFCLSLKDNFKRDIYRKSDTCLIIADIRQFDVDGDCICEEAGYKMLEWLEEDKFEWPIVILTENPLTKEINKVYRKCVCVVECMDDSEQVKLLQSYLINRRD